jgi:tetratricopeptide (TPR) repeat protein
MLLNNKAAIYDAIGDRKGAIDTYEKIVSDFSGNIDVRGAWVLAANNLATLYMKTDYPEKAIKMLESLSSENKEYKQLFKQNLTLAYYISDDAKLRSTLKDYNNICYNNCLDVFNFFTESEREDYWTSNARELLIINNLVADKHQEITDVAYNNLLFVKNLKLMSSDILKKIVENSSNLELKKKYKGVVYKRRVKVTEPEAIAFMNRTGALRKQNQISREILYFRDFYQTLSPKVYLCYDREAWYDPADKGFRMTLDRNVRYRTADLSLSSSFRGRNILEPGQTLLEVKAEGAVPLWLVELLTCEQIYKQSFSKYGKAYLQMLNEHLALQKG